MCIAFSGLFIRYSTAAMRAWSFSQAVSPPPPPAFSSVCSLTSLMHVTFFLCFEYITCIVAQWSELQYIGNELKQQSEVRSNIKDMQMFEVYSYTSHILRIQISHVMMISLFINIFLASLFHFSTHISSINYVV